MKYIIYLALFAIAFGNLNSLEPELYSTKGVTFMGDFIRDGDVVYLFGLDDKYGREIWKFDGSIGGIDRVTNLPDDASPVLIKIVNGKLLFGASANDGQKSQLWSTDGSKESEELLVEFNSDYNTFAFTSTSDETSCIFEGNYYTTVFNKESKLFEAWVSDGTPEGTYNYSEKINLYDIISLNVVADKLVITNYSENELFRYELNLIELDGSKIKLAEFEGELYSLNTNNKLERNNKLFFFDESLKTSKSYIWVTGGSKEGTFKIAEVININDFDWNDYYIKEIGNDYFIKYKSFVQGSGYIWHALYTDGTLENTLDLRAKIGDSRSIYIYDLDIVNGNFLYWQADAKGSKLWSTDGTESGTKVIFSDQESEFYPGREYLKYNDKIYSYFTTKSNETVLLESDGTAKNTNELINLSEEIKGDIGNIFWNIKVYNNSFVFLAELNKFYKLNLETVDLEFIQEVNRTTHFKLEKYNKQLYLNQTRSNFYYFNDYRNNFEEIEPSDVNNKYFFLNNKILFKNYLYFISDYYNGGGYKLYRIDNTFQTVSNVETQPTDELNLYPNPTGDFLNVSVDEPTSVSIIDLTGKVVISLDNYNGEGVNTSNLPTGVYSIILDENTYGGKFVKE